MADATRRPDLRASRRKAMRKLATFMAASPLLTHAEPRQQYPQRFPRVRSGRLAARHAKRHLAVSRVAAQRVEAAAHHAAGRPAESGGDQAEHGAAAVGSMTSHETTPASRSWGPPVQSARGHAEPRTCESEARRLR